MSLLIRPAHVSDTQALLEIYRPYVLETAITFEYDVPSLTEFSERLLSITEKYPYLVAEEDGSILGYAYASAFNSRAAYAWSAEVSIYLAQEVRGRGIGRKLYEALEHHLREMGILNLNACIATTEVSDPYLTNASQAFHEKLGFQLVGRFHQSGYKFGRWYDMIWMEKLLDTHSSTPKPITYFPKLRLDE